MKRFGLALLNVAMVLMLLAGCGSGGGTPGAVAPPVTPVTPPVVDTTAPTVPANPSATALSTSAISLGWSASADDTAVVGYKIYRDGIYLKTVAQTSASDTALVASTQYCFAISAFDASGNESLKSAETCTTTLAVTPPPITFAAQTGWQLSQVATDGNILVATGLNDSNAVAIAFNSDGTIRWQKNDLPGAYGKSKIANGNLYASRASWSNGTDTAHIDKIDVATGSIVTAVTGTVPDQFGLSATCGSLALSADKIYVAASDGAGGQMTFSNFDLSLNNKTSLSVYNASCFADMDVSAAGNFFYNISDQEIYAYTMDGVYFGYTIGPAAARFHNTIANGNILYVSGSLLTQTSVVAYVWAYDLNGDLQQNIPVGIAEAEGMNFGPDGEMYVALSFSGNKGPVRIDPSTGTIAWTGNVGGHSVVYYKGMAILATGSNTLAVFDAATGTPE